MAVQSSTKINLGKLGEFRLAGASGGISLTTTAAFTELPLKTTRILLTPRNFSTAVVVKVAINPWLVVLKTTNNMSTAPTDYSNAAQDASTDTSVDLSSLDTVANGDWMLVGSHVPFRGVYFDIDGTNSTTGCTGSVYYWAGSWTNTSATMTGVTSSTFLDQDGIVTWTVPTAWQAERFSHIYPNLKQNKYYSDVPLYWTQWRTSKAIDSSVTIDMMVAANRSTSYGELVEGQMISADIEHGFGGVGNIEALTNAGTANLVALCISKGLFE